MAKYNKVGLIVCSLLMCFCDSGEYVDRPYRVAKKYFKEGFLWDFVASVPFSWAEYFWYLALKYQSLL
jgi:hypothetical protein